MITLDFYTTLGCHLCEDALVLLKEAMLKEALNKTMLTHRFKLVSVEISEDDRLVERYGVRIPVVVNRDTQQELCWPFDKEGLAAFLAFKT